MELGALVNDGNAGDTLLAGPSGGENTWKLEEEKLEEEKLAEENWRWKNWRRSAKMEHLVTSLVVAWSVGERRRHRGSVGFCTIPRVPRCA